MRQNPPPGPSRDKIFDILYKHRFHSLDGVRGVAALCVGLTHCMKAVAPPPVLAAAFGGAVAQAFFNGGVLADIFFILSGFFLTGMMESVGARLHVFYIRRFVRLVPPALVSIAICMLLADSLAARGIANPLPSNDLAFYRTTQGSGPLTLLQNFVLLRHGLNPPLWTMRVELAISAVFPLLFWLKNASARIWYRFTLFAFLAALAGLLRHHLAFGAVVFHYLHIFYAGVLARDYGPHLARLARPWRVGLLATGLAMLVGVGAIDPPGSAHPFLDDFFCALAGAPLIALVAFGQLRRVDALLTRPALQFVGRISYSFYLVNYICVVAAMIILGSLFAPPLAPLATVMLLLAISVPLTFATAYILNVLIEQTSVAFSRSLGARFA